MELNHLKYFYTVAKEGGFTRAARMLRVQQPTISKTVRQLEDELGHVLLERHRAGIRLTKAGAEIFRHCEDIFGRIDEIATLSARERTECHGMLAFGMTDSVCSYVLPRIMKRFLKTHPSVRPSVFAGSSNLICAEIIEGRVEFGVFFTKPDAEAFQVSDVVDVPFLLVCSTQAVRRFPGKMPIIMSRDIDYPRQTHFPVLSMLQRNQVRMDVVISSNNLDAQKQMVIEGLGVALLPGFMVANEVKHGTLTPLYARKTFTHPLKLVTRKRKVLSRNAATFFETFCKDILHYV